MVPWAVNYCQEASFVGCARWLGRMGWKPGSRVMPWLATGAHRDASGMPAAACRWRAGPSHLLSFRTLNVYERDGENARFYTSLPRSVSCIKIFPWCPFLCPLLVTSSGRQFCLCLSNMYVEWPWFQHASVFSCQLSHPCDI